MPSIRLPFGNCYLHGEPVTLAAMADKKFVIGYKAGDKAQFLTVEASSVDPFTVKEGTCWKISGDKGTMWVSGEAFIYGFPAAMFVKND